MSQYFVSAFTNLPDPASNIPFHQQASPLPDPYQTHVQSVQVSQCTSYATTNPLPYGHFVGRFHRQIAQPQFLGINEQLYDPPPRR